MLRLGLGLGLGLISGSAGSGSAPAFDPSTISGLIRGWDFGAVSGNDVTSVPAAWGTTAALTLAGSSGSPDALTAFAPDDANMLGVTASNSEVGTCTTTGALGTFSFAMTFAPKNASAPVPLFGGPGNSYLQLNQASSRLSITQFRTDSSSANTATIGSTAAYVWPKGCYLIIGTYDVADGILHLDINGTAHTHTRSGNFTFDRLFKQGSAAVYGDGMYGVFAFWNKVLSAGEIAQVKTGWSAKKAGRIYLSQAGDDTNNFGFSKATPLKLLLTQLTFAGIAQRSGISLKRGEEWNEGVASGFVTSGADASNKFIFDAWGSGTEMPYLWQSPRATGWTSIGSNKWTLGSVTALPGAVWRIVDKTSHTENSVVKLSHDETLASDNTYAWDDPTDTITLCLPTGIDPTVVDIRIVAGTLGKGFNTSANYVSVRDLSFRFFFGEGARPTGTGVEFLRCEHSWNYGDGLDCNGANVEAHDGWSVGNGPSIASSGQGDGFSAHGTGTYAISGMYIVGNSLGGCRSEQYTSGTIDSCTIKGNGNDIMVLQQGTGSIPALTAVTNSAITTTAASLTGYPAQIQASVDVTTVLSFTGTTFTNSGGSQSDHAIDVLGGTLTDGGGNVKSGYTSLHN